jgi:phosphoribosylaminoimidazolecarboxamide formyltransferase/IMP cyclohydrolase
MAMNIVEKIDDRIHVKHALISVSDKSGLEAFVPRLLSINPDMRIFSTGGTFARLREILGSSADDCLMQVADYTGQPETQGGLVKTLDFKIYLGLLTETYNDAHQSDLQRTGAVPIDLVVVNLYPFRETVAKAGITPEQARGNIDIGGPCMIRAAAKNFIRVAAVVDPADYGRVADEMAGAGGSIPLALRYRLARKAFAHTAAYDTAIAGYLDATDIAAVQAAYRRQNI